MTLLDGRQTVQVQLRSAAADAVRGKSVMTPVGDLIDVKCNVQPLSSADRLILGGTVADTFRNVTAKTWPGDVNSLIVWDGFDWNTFGDPQFFSMGSITDHWEIRIEKGPVHVDGV